MIVTNSRCHRNQFGPWAGGKLAGVSFRTICLHLRVRQRSGTVGKAAMK